MLTVLRTVRLLNGLETCPLTPARRALTCSNLPQVALKRRMAVSLKSACVRKSRTISSACRWDRPASGAERVHSRKTSSGTTLETSRHPLSTCSPLSKSMQEISTRRKQILMIVLVLKEGSITQTVLLMVLNTLVTLHSRERASSAHVPRSG